MSGRFTERVAIVTGGGRGIGAATAVAFAAEGASVGVVDVDAEVVDEVVGKITSAGGTALACPCDVRDPDAVERAVASVVDEYGGLDVLVNNAGIQRYGTVETTPLNEWDDVIDINLKGQFLLARFAVPHLRARGGGAIVNVASVQAFATQPGVIAYAASKGAIVAMTKTMALDHASDRIRVNAVAPGSVRTPMLEWAAGKFAPGDPDAAIADWGSKHPLGEVTTPDQVARLILFLASDDASAMTGGTHLIDAGLLAKIGV